MKIGIDVRCLMGGEYSGVAFYTLNLLKNLFELDSTNEYLLFYNSSRRKDLPDFNYKNVKYVGFRCPNKLLNLSLMLFKWPKLDKLIGGVDIFFIPNLNFCALSDQTKKVVTIHDLSFAHFPDFFSLKMRAWHLAINWRRLIENANKLIAVSNSTKEDIIKLNNVSSDKIQVVYEGVDDKFKVIDDLEALERVRKKYNLPNKFILSLGTIEPRKNIEGVINAYNLGDCGCELVISGGGGWKNDIIYKQVRKNDKIMMIGYVDEEDKVALYNLAELLVYPSYYEGFGLPIVEAMACGTPTVVGANSSMLEIAKNAAVLVNSSDEVEISLGIRAILEDEEFKDQLIQRGLELTKGFTWNKVAEETLQLFNNLN
jgi:glycosyltransferase involved in cell wall biosynthesis